MKKIYLAAALGCLLASCDNMKSTESNAGDDMAKRNLDACHAVNEAFRTGDVSKIDSFVAADFVDHSDHGDVKGLDSFKAMVQMVHTNFPDMKMETIKEVADKEYVFEMMRYSGNSDGKMMPPGPYDMHVVEVIRFNNEGKGVEHWAYMDSQEMMKMAGQMQNMPQPGMEHKMAADTTMKK